MRRTQRKTPDWTGLIARYYLVLCLIFLAVCLRSYFAPAQNVGRAAVVAPVGDDRQAGSDNGSAGDTPDPLTAAPGLAQALQGETFAAIGEEVDVTGALATFHGQVLSFSGDALPGAEVSLISARTDLPVALTDENGRWTLTPPAESRAVGVAASHPEHDADRVQLTDATWSGAEAIELRLRPISHVSGVVTDKHGVLLPGVVLTVWPGAQIIPNAYIRDPLGEVTTDELGRFSLRLGRDQLVRIGCRFSPAAGDPAKGYEPLEKLVRRVEDRPDQQWHLVLPTPVALKVTVHIDRELHQDVSPSDLERMQVGVVHEQLGLRSLRRAPVHDGSARVADLDPSVPWAVGLLVPGYLPSSVSRAVWLKGPETTLAVSLPELQAKVPPARRSDQRPPWYIPWKLTNGSDDRAVPVSEAMAALSTNWVILGHGTAESLVTGEQQSFMLEFDGRSSSGYLHLSIEEPVRVEIQLNREIVVFPRLSAQDQISLVLPSADTTHLVELRPLDEFGRVVLSVGIEVWSASTGEHRMLVSTSEGRTEARLPAGEYRAQVRPVVGLPVALHLFLVPSARADGVIELRMSSAGSLRGQVLQSGSDGTVFEVLVEDEATPGWSGNPTLRTVRQDGSFDVPALPAGKKRVALWARDEGGVGTMVAQTTVTIVPGQTSEVQLVPLWREGGRAVTFESESDQGLAIWISTTSGAPGTWWASYWQSGPVRLALGLHDYTYQQAVGPEGEVGLSVMRSGSFTVEAGEGTQVIELR